jgi:CheY-like chemotaxis protein
VLGIDVPIIAFTANAIAGAKEEYLAAGMNDLLTKPINKALLFKILKDWIPAEKIKLEPSRMQPTDKDETKTNVKFWEKVESIKGLSVSTGLDMVSGQRDVYEDSLDLTKKEIEKCDKNLKTFLSSGDMGNFFLLLHGMKGTLDNLGAMELSANALELEAAADRADAAFCAENLPHFLEKLNDLSVSIAEAFALLSSTDGKAITIPPELVPVFDTLLVAFKATDFLAIDDGMERLNTFNTDSSLKGEIEKIKEAVVVMDYEGAAEVIKKLLK